MPADSKHDKNKKITEFTTKISAPSTKTSHQHLTLIKGQ